MYERLILLRELLSDKGTIYLHCDWHKAHHLRILMDEVFGPDKFVNEVIWHYSGAGTPKGCWAKRHDNLFLYSKTSKYTFNADEVRTEYYDPESGRIRQYYPYFLAKMADGSYQLIEVKGDNKIDDTVVKAKQAAAEEMVVASGVKYLMYAGSRIVSSHILDDMPMETQQGTLPLGV